MHGQGGVGDEQAPSASDPWKKEGPCSGSPGEGGRAGAWGDEGCPQGRTPPHAAALTRKETACAVALDACARRCARTGLWREEEDEGVVSEQEREDQGHEHQ